MTTVLDQNKMCRLRDIYKAISEVENQMESAYGLNLNEAMLLCQLKEKAGITAGEVGHLLGLLQPTASKVIRSLEKKRWLSRSIDENDKRVMHYRLTQEGQEKLQTLDCEHILFPPILESLL